ncbi:MAG: hypothetical protein QW506_02750 [Thermoproteota archaeon]
MIKYWSLNLEEFAQQLKKYANSLLGEKNEATRADRFSLIAMFNPKGMDDEEKIRVIEKAIDAVEEARKRL